MPLCAAFFSMMTGTWPRSRIQYTWPSSLITNRLMASAVTLLLIANGALAFDVVGWYVGSNTADWPLEELNWDVYSTIRLGGIRGYRGCVVASWRSLSGHAHSPRP